MSRLRIFLGSLLAMLVFSGCESSLQREFNQGQKYAQQGYLDQALDSYQKVIARGGDTPLGLQAAREAARISFFEKKDFLKAADFYGLLVLNSNDPDERVRAQKQVTSAYLDHLNNYGQAIVEINKLLPLLTDPSERMQFKMDLARAYYYQNNFYQAEMEVDEFLRVSKNPEQNFQMKLLLANIALARKDLGHATELLKGLIQSNPDLAAKENVGLILAVAYEEMKDYKSAIAVLQGMKKDQAMPEYIDLRIKHLQELLKNQPGARGYHK